VIQALLKITKISLFYKLLTNFFIIKLPGGPWIPGGPGLPIIDRPGGPGGPTKVFVSSDNCSKNDNQNIIKTCTLKV